MNTWRHILVLLFWLSASGVLYSYAGYPVIVFVLARLFGRRRSKLEASMNAEVPSVSLIIAAHNEASVIEVRIRNALLMDYPKERLEIVVASDGSTDETATIACRFERQGVRLIDNIARRGKATVLNSAVPSLSGEIVILSDANTLMDPQAARSLVRWFEDPQIGVVCGRLILNDPVSGKNVDSLYWRYETFLKRNESRLGALLGSNGAIYAIRRNLFCPIPDQTIVDDFVIPLFSRLRFGCQIVYDERATAEEESAPDMSTEFERRARIGAGGWQAIGILWRLLNPARGWIAFTFFSHKVLRWLCPFFMLLMLTTNLLLLGSPWYLQVLYFQLALYMLAFAGARVSRTFPLGRILRLAHMFLTMNAALFVGFFRWVAGSQRGTWDRTRRTGEIQSGIAAEIRF
jgi:cellulose synthase/poly-beta-1,6-N-acetylglucosamine synthase-like glycosyltransferase